MAFLTINSADLEVGKAIKKSTLTQVKDNLDDLDSRVAALGASANKISMFEKDINFSDLGIGEIVASNLTTSEFQSINGTDWRLCNGGSASGTLYASITGHSNYPDYRGEFLRGADQGRGVDSGRVLDSFQADQMEQHSHVIANTIQQVGNANTGIPLDTLGTLSPKSTNNTGGTTNASENRPRNVSVNYFIRVDARFKFNIKARENQTIVNIKAYVIDYSGMPTAGNLEIDIKKSSDRSTLTSIFSVLPTLAYSAGILDGDSTTSGTISGAGATISTGEWVELSITSVMTNQTGVYVQIFSEPS